MNKKTLFYAIVVLVIIALIGLGILIFNSSFNKDALNFKHEYESLNGTKNKLGKEHRTIKISRSNPYVKINPDEVVKMIEEGKTFYLYVGDPLCPWCRSTIEKSIEVAKENKIKTIYYIDIWDEEGNEIFRDKYELKNGKPVLTIKPVEAYTKLLKAFDSVLADYTLTDEEGDTVKIGEKRIYAPNFFYVENGKVVKMITGNSEKQKDSREELTDEILQDEENQYKEFFKN